MFRKAIRSHGYCQSQADHTMFHNHLRDKKVAILIVYVEDTILIDYDNVELERFNKRLVDDFEIKDFGMLKYVLRMEFARSKEDIFVNLHKYVPNLLGETSLFGCKEIETLIESNLNLQFAKTKNVVNRESTKGLLED